MDKVYRVRAVTLRQFVDVLKDASTLALDYKDEKLYREIARSQKQLYAISKANAEVNETYWSKVKNWLAFRYPDVWWLFFKKDL